MVMAENSIWDALAMGEETIVRRARLNNGFHWTDSHPQFGSVIHAVCFGLIATVDENLVDGYKAYYDLVTDDDEGVEKRLGLLRFAMDQGASPHIVAPASCDDSRNWEHDDDPQLTTQEVHFAGKSAIGCLLGAKRVLLLAMADGDWMRKVERIDRAVDVVSQDRGPQGPRVFVSDRVLDTWAAVLADTASADVTILVGPQLSSGSAGSGGSSPGAAGSSVKGGEGAGEGGQALAHSNVLQAASPVLAAMLYPGMREGARKEIVVEDCSMLAVQMLLSLTYSASLPGEVDATAETLLEALGLAHRWHIQHVVEMLVAAVRRLIDSKSFEPIFETALRLSIVDLAQACRTYATNHEREMKARLYPPQSNVRRGASGGGGASERSGAGGAAGVFKSPTVSAEVARLLSCDARSSNGSQGDSQKKRRVF